jgi:hypothetical protein
MWIKRQYVIGLDNHPLNPKRAVAAPENGDNHIAGQLPRLWASVDDCCAELAFQAPRSFGLICRP